MHPGKPSLTARAGPRGLLAMALAVVASLGAVEGAAADVRAPSVTYVESFERGFGGWRPDHHIHCEAEDPPCPFDWSIDRSTEQARDGRYSLRGFLDGRWDDGSIWVERPVDVRRAREVTLEVGFWLWSQQQSDVNTFPVLAFADRHDPEAEADFAIVGQTDQVAGWHRYTYRQTFCSGWSRQAWVAFGFGATWETARTYFLDLAEVTVSHRQTPSCARRPFSPA